MSPLARWSLVVCLGLIACGESESSPADTVEPKDISDVRDVPEVRDTAIDDTADDPDTVDTSAPVDVSIGDGDAVDSDTPVDTDTADTDTVTPETWTYSPPQTACGETRITFDPPGDPSQVLVTGSFAGWASTAPAALSMSRDAGGRFSAVTTLAPGDHQLKFIVDGTWMPDPDKALVDDGFGGFNNQIKVAPCIALRLIEYTVTGHRVVARFDSRTTRIAPEDVTVTLNHTAVPNPWVVDGDTLVLEMDDLTHGIHDVRVTHAGTTLLLKVYIGVSPDWRDAVLYFVMTDRFADGDPTNNAPAAEVDARVNWMGGDFAGVRQKLEAGYFDNLGVNTLWLSWPIAQATGFHEGSRPSEHRCGQASNNTAQTPTRFTAYHGYWPSRLDAIEPRFGTLSELQTLVHVAHQRGIRILLDFTANHVHESSPMYQQHGQDGWFNQPAQVCEVVGWDNAPKTCWFTPYLPDLDYRSPGLRQAMLDHAVDIALKTGADGYRLDAVKHIEPGFLPDLRQRLAERVELTGIPFYLVGETFSGDVVQIDAFIGRDKLHGQFDFPVNYKILQGLARSDIGLNALDSDVRGIRRSYRDPTLMSTFIGNHDMGRFLSMAAGDMFCGVWDLYADIAQGWLYPPPQPSAALPYQKLALAFAYIMTIPGVPLIYYGDEVGLAGANDPDNRRPMVFGDALTARQDEAFDLVAAWTRARTRYPSLSRGDWPAPILSETDLVAFARTLPEEKSLVVLNRGTTTRSVAIPLASLGVPGGARFTDVMSGGVVSAAGGTLTVEVPAVHGKLFVYSVR